MLSNCWKQFTKAELDKHYNPTLCTPRLTPEELLPAHEKLVIESSVKYRETLSENGLFETINSGSGDLATEVDVFKPTLSAANKPVVIYIHGGWWQWFSKDHFSFVAKPFNEAGATVYIPAYKMAQDWENTANPIQVIFQQLKTAIAQVLLKAEKNQAGKVYITGHSAGGHLAAMMTFVNWQEEFGLSDRQVSRIAGIIPLSGLYDVRPLVNSFVNDAMGIDEMAAEQVSPYYLLNQLQQETPLAPVYLVLPEYDPQEFYRQAREFQLLMHEKNKHCDVLFIPKVDHLDMIENFMDNDYLLTQYMLDIISQ